MALTTSFSSTENRRPKTARINTLIMTDLSAKDFLSSSLKSKLVHVGNLMQGLNGSLIAANIVRRIELNTDLCSEDYGQKCVPPTVLFI